MQPDPSRRDLARPDLARRLKVFVPLAAGAVLVGIFVFLLVRLGGHDERKPARVPRGPGNIIVGPSPYEKEPKPPRPPAEKGLKRWKFDKLPEGWDPKLAAEIARYFEEMEVPDSSYSDKLAALQDKREEFAAFLATLGPEAIPTLSAILGQEEDFVCRRFLIDALGDLGPKSDDATIALFDFYMKNRDVGIDADHPVGDAYSELGHLIEAMSRLKNDSSYSVMVNQIADAGTPAPYRDKFIRALGEHPERESAIPQISHLMAEDEDPNCRNNSAQFLGKTRRPEDVDDIIAAFGHENVYWVKQTMLGSIGKTGDEKAIPFLEGVALRGDGDGVRLSAANALHLINTPKAQRALREVLQAERDETIRKNIQEWLQSPPKGR